MRGGVACAAVYGVATFAAGFACGALRELALIPAFGPRGGHLVEFPLMIAAVLLIAQRLVRGRHATSAQWLGVGLAGAALLVAIEAAFALFILKRPPEDYVAGFDVTRGALFPYGLAIMAIAPTLLARRG
ncbi:MAG: hypothetical protein JNK46_10005 [Methylobacteriaceae bacterium]|nr:hypothetical protein [Methylobacteriaceae bacterium]